MFYNVTSTGQTWGGRHFEKDGLDVDAISDNEFVFVGFDSSNASQHVWIDLLEKKPVKEAVLWRDALDRASSDEFSSYFSELLSIWGEAAEVYVPEASIDSAAAPLQWELNPPGDPVDYAEVGFRDGANARFVKGVANPARDDASLSLTDWVSTTIDISSLGLTWPPVSGWSYLQTRDEFLRRYGTDTEFTVADLPDPSISAWDPYLQYRTFGDSTKNEFRGWIAFHDFGLPIKDVITDIWLTNLTTSVPVPITEISFDENTYYWNDSSNSANNQLNPFWDVRYYSGYGVGFPAGTDLAAGDYQFEATTKDGDTMSGPVFTFGGRIDLPVVEAASMQSEWINGDLKLSWQNQTVPPQTQIRIWIVGGDTDSFRVIMGINLSPNFQEVTIPKRVIDSAKILRDFDSASWRIELRYHENSINSGRGVSDWVEIAGWK